MGLRILPWAGQWTARVEHRPNGGGRGLLCVCVCAPLSSIYLTPSSYLLWSTRESSIFNVWSCCVPNRLRWGHWILNLVVVWGQIVVFRLRSADPRTPNWVILLLFSMTILMGSTTIFIPFGNFLFVYNWEFNTEMDYWVGRSLGRRSFLSYFSVLVSCCTTAVHRNTNKTHLSLICTALISH